MFDNTPHTVNTCKPFVVDTKIKSSFNDTLDVVLVRK